MQKTKKLSKNISIFVPAYNVEKHLGKVVRRIPQRIMQRVKTIFIINDGSRDLTQVIASRLSRVNPRIKVVRFVQNKGYGTVVKTGLDLCLRSQSKYIVCLHGDGQYAPGKLPEMLKKLQEKDLDIIQGSRIASGTALSGKMPLYKYLANRFLTALENIVFHLQLSDYHSGYLIYHQRFLKKIDYHLFSNSFDIDLELLAAARYHGFKIGEIPIPTHYGAEKSYLNPLDYGLRVLGIMISYLCGKYSKTLRNL